MFGKKARPDADPWRALRYQLLTAVAGKAIEAPRREAATAVVIVHEFLTANMNDKSLKVTTDDFRAFVGVLCACRRAQLPKADYMDRRSSHRARTYSAGFDLFIGKAVFDWSAKDETLANEREAKPYG